MVKFEIDILLKDDVEKPDPETIMHILNEGLKKIDQRYGMRYVDETS